MTLTSSSTAQPKSLPENHPLAMSRLQQSARDMLRNFENAMASTPISAANSTSTRPLSDHTTTKSSDPSVPASFEQTLRSMFTSCTFGATTATNDDDDDTNSRTTTFDVVEGAVTSSTDSSSSFDVPIKPKIKRSKSAVIPTKATAVSSTKDNLRRLASMHIIESTNLKQQQKQQEKSRLPPPPHRSSDDPSSSKVAADHIYEHLFFAEEQARRAASTAVTTPPNTRGTVSPNLNRSIVSPQNLQKQTTHGALPPSLPVPSPSPIEQSGRVGIVPLRRMTQPFPMSKPQIVPSQTLHTSTLSTPDITIVSRSLTFDDDISAISAHTLEAMTMVHNQKSSILNMKHTNDAHVISEESSSQPPSLSKPYNTSMDIVSTKNDYNVITPTKHEVYASHHNNALCRASTIPHANHANQGQEQEREDVEPMAISNRRIPSSSSSSALLSKQRSYNYTSSDKISSPGFRYGTPCSSNSMTSHNSGKPLQCLNPTTSSFSPCTSGGSGNRSFDQWRTVEQEFWQSVVANEDEECDDQGLLTGMTEKKKGKSSTQRQQKSQQQRIRHRRNHSIDGWSERSGSNCRSRGATTADSTIFSSSVTRISHGSGSSHGTMQMVPQQRSSSWLALHPQHHPHETFPFASTAIPNNHDDGFFLDDHRRSVNFDAIDSGEI